MLKYRAAAAARIGSGQFVAAWDVKCGQLAGSCAIDTTVTSDVSRYLLGWWFRNGIRGKDDIILASVAATLLLAVLFAAFLFASGAPGSG